MMRRFLAVFALVILGCASGSGGSAYAAAWEVAGSESRIGFSGAHAGRGFKGQFRTFAATIDFDPANLAAAKAEVTIDLSSAATGEATYDKTLPTPDWFDIAKTPKAAFKTGAFKSLGGDRYEAEGSLEIKGLTAPVVLAFEAKIDGDTLRIDGRTKLSRLAFGIGKASDASGAWVSLDIPVEVAVVARRK